MKKRRQAKILEIISSDDVETQEELQEKLLSHGYEVTQATISRDIKELRLVKDLSSKGRYVYSTGKKNVENIALNTVVIKCFSGMANAACAAIDSMTIDSVLGTIAGDDTIFVLCRTEDAAMTFTNKMRAMLNA